MESKIKRTLKDSIRKNSDELLALATLSLPAFIYKSYESLSPAEIPVFNFHKVNAERLEAQLKYLSDNGYKTLSADDLYLMLTGKLMNSANTIALTFDDGRKDLWLIAYPLLKKYNFKAIAFIIPSVIKESQNPSFNLEQVWSGKISHRVLENIPDKFCNWKEISTMHESGLIDFQSHSMFHASVFTDDKLNNFVNPQFRSSILDSTFNPLEGYHYNSFKYGAPVYNWAPNLTADTRFIPNSMVVKSCLKFVSDNGNAAFFARRNWKTEITDEYKRIINKENSTGVFQQKEAREHDIFTDLYESKKIIEKKLNKQVLHFCYPWFRGNTRSVEISKKCGYKSSYWGIVNNNSINKIVDDPMFIKRINDYYIFSLPGRKRLPLVRQLISKLKVN